LTLGADALNFLVEFPKLTYSMISKNTRSHGYILVLTFVPDSFGVNKKTGSQYTIIPINTYLPA